MSYRSKDLLSFEPKSCPDSLLIVKKNSHKRPRTELNTSRVESELIPAIQNFLEKVKAERNKGLEDCSSSSESSGSSGSSVATSSGYSIARRDTSNSSSSSSSSSSEETSSSEEEAQQVQLNVLFYKREHDSSDSSSSSSESDSDSD